MGAVAFARRQFGGGAPSTTVPGGIGLTDTSDTLASGSNWPSGGSGFFYVVADLGNSNEEKILCASTVGNLLTYATGGRGADGTAAAVHLANCTIKVCHVAQDDDEANHMVNILGNAAVGALFLGGGTAAVPTTLAIGANLSVPQSNGTTLAYQTPSNGYGITGFAAAPMVPAVALTKTSSFITNAVNLTANTDTNVTSISLAAGTWIITWQASVASNYAGDANVDVFVSTASAAATGAVSVGSAGIGTTLGGAQTAMLSGVCIVTPAITTTYYLNAEATETAQVSGPSNVLGIASLMSGISAVRIA